MIAKGKRKLGELLLEAGLLTKDQLDELLKKQKLTGQRVGEILIQDKILTEKQVIEVLEFQLRIPFIDFKKQYINPETPRLISETLARKHLMIPVEKKGKQLTLAMVDPLDLNAIDDASMFTMLEIKPGISILKDLLMALDRYYGKESAERAVEDIAKERSIDELNDVVYEMDDVSNAPVVRLVNSLIQHAVRARASDIHIEPNENNLRIRFRVDGELQEVMTSSKLSHSAIVTRIKILGNMNIAEKRVPQEGKEETVVDDRNIDLRISILPTIYGEKIVIRLLDRSGIVLSKAQLGFSEESIRRFETLIKSPNGIILVTGPTGSGKTTTLYSALLELNQVNRNISTIEDPVEYRLQGVNQIQVNTKAGLNFASGLRSILRQDPDIIMIGEIRDAETAQIAVRAAITGHLVLSTMHTNDSASTVSRLMDMGIESYLVSSSVVGVVAQRLVRKICENCKESYEPGRTERDLLRISRDQPLFRGTGCNLCSMTGYLGRTAINEIMILNREIRELIDLKATIESIRNASEKFGTISLKESCRQLVLAGTTTRDEYIKTTYNIE